ncbi:MerR family transcriptional regulator [Solibacillus sp. A46]|uniref:MerR family transcriptional regulator n=1 Tax=Solibacillus faecavium TaxID=2762221 RepID=A0ABR8XY17_9BACL|nr:MerR family transcriptional regulator [Solibacillus faecavium]MBD8036809.1 MerR family transcriptional regulator [Solibacillus faecavium]
MKSIKVIAKEYALTTRTLRYYEELGILKPTRRDNGMRHYSKREEAKIKLIVRGKKYGFSMEEIKEMILLFNLDRTGVKQLERTIEYGQQKLKEIDEKIQELYEIRQDIEKTEAIFREKLTQLLEEQS